MLLVGKQRGYIYTSKLKPLYTASFHIVKLSGFGIGIMFETFSSRTKQLRNWNCKYLNCEIVNIRDLDTWPKILLNNFQVKNCLSLATNIVKNSDMIVTMKKHLIDQVNGILVMTMLEMLQFFVLIIAHRLTTIISKITF